MLLVIPGLAVPAFNQVYIDAVILQQRTDWLRPLLLAMGVSGVLTAALHFMQFRFLRRLKIKLSIKFSSKYLWHLLHLPASFYAQRFAGEIANRSQINTKLADLLSGRLATTAIDVTMMGFYAALMFYYDVILTLIGIGFQGINVPLSLLGIGSSSCLLTVSPMFVFGAAPNTSGNPELKLPLPNDPSLAGGTVPALIQALVSTSSTAYVSNRIDITGGAL